MRTRQPWNWIWTKVSLLRQNFPWSNWRLFWRDLINLSRKSVSMNHLFLSIGHWIEHTHIIYHFPFFYVRRKRTYCLKGSTEITHMCVWWYDCICCINCNNYLSFARFLIHMNTKKAKREEWNTETLFT